MLMPLLLIGGLGGGLFGGGGGLLGGLGGLLGGLFGGGQGIRTAGVLPGEEGPGPLSGLPLPLRELLMQLLGLSGDGGDLIGTMLGLKPVIGADAVFSPGVAAQTGLGVGSPSAFADYPFRGGSAFNINNTFTLPPGLTELEYSVTTGILEAMRRLGVY